MSNLSIQERPTTHHANTQLDFIDCENDLLRYDRDLAFNGLSFKESFQEDANDIINIIKYIGFQYQFNHDAFHFDNVLFPELYNSNEELKNCKMMVFDPAKYCKFSGDDRDNLRKTHPSPKYLIDHFGDSFLKEIHLVESYTLTQLLLLTNKKNEKDDPKLKYKLIAKVRESIVNKYMNLYPKDVHWNTMLDNALYRSTEGIRQHNQFKSPYKDQIIASTGKIQVILNVNKVIEAKGKIKYILYVNKTYLDNCQRYFISNSNSTQIRKRLKIKNSIILDDYIKFYKTTAILKKINEISINFNELSYITDTYKIESEAAKKQRIIERFEDWKEIKNDNETTLHFRTAHENSKFCYKPVFIFSNPDSSPSKYLLKKAFVDELTHMLMEEFLNKHNGESVEDYNTWASNPRADIQTKFNIYQKAYKAIYRDECGAFNKEMNKYFNYNM